MQGNWATNVFEIFVKCVIRLGSQYTPAQWNRAYVQARIFEGIL